MKCEMFGKSDKEIDAWPNNHRCINCNMASECYSKSRYNEAQKKE